MDRQPGPLLLFAACCWLILSRSTFLQAILSQLPEVEALRAVTGAYVPVMEMKVRGALGKSELLALHGSRS